ncbi:phage tail protein [Photorhabdus tasmaniensis]|uniref:Phage tail protein n=1 Tax=Photorhabdus tasmaniensis TaxID=1004159 RepID=A0ABX0GDM6_9GAMM|nr:phage tail protein [Photorhabdus tasmaniensis]NHB87183.1 phage tail protein [Photorhabdus tasmaniensis]
MSQIESLTEFLIEHMPPRAMQQFSSAVDNASLIPAAKNLGLDQRRLGIFRYTAVLNWGDFPYRICPPARLYALVLIWIEQFSNELYEELDVAAPTVDIEFDEEFTSPLEITLELADSVDICLSEDGDILIDEKRYSLANPALWTATRGWLYATDQNGAPLDKKS